MRKSFPAICPSPAPSAMLYFLNAVAMTAAPSKPAGTMIAVTVSEFHLGSFAHTLSPHALTAARTPSASRWCRAYTLSSPSSRSMSSDSRNP